MLALLEGVVGTDWPGRVVFLLGDFVMTGGLAPSMLDREMALDCLPEFLSMPRGTSSSPSIAPSR